MCNEILRATRRCVKLMGERVMAREFDRQVAELQVRAAISWMKEVYRATCWQSSHQGVPRGLPHDWGNFHESTY